MKETCLLLELYGATRSVELTGAVRCAIGLYSITVWLPVIAGVLTVEDRSRSSTFAQIESPYVISD